MTVAYLIMAHHQPAHLKRLIQQLDTEFAHFFIHLDLKTDFADFKDIQGPNITFVDRHSVSHGGFSLTMTMVKLLRAATQAGPYDYYTFLSGMDYPIKRNEYIYDFLKKNYGQNFITFYRLTGEARLVDHISRYYLVDFVYKFPKSISRYVKQAIKGVNLFLPKRPFIKGITPYRGATWATLHKDAALYIARYLNTSEGKNLLNFFKYSWGSDEILFHTILLNSPLASRCRYYERDINKDMIDENKAYLHYVDWDPNREDPAVLDESDFEKLKKSEFLFARKFAEEKSAKLLDMVDKMLSEQNHKQRKTG